MADINIAISFVLSQEDSTLSGKGTTLQGDSGGRTRFGLAEKWHPELTATGYFDTMSRGQALRVAEDAYQNDYAKGLSLDAIKNQDVANRLLSFVVNQGPKPAIKIIQQAVCQSGHQIAVDGSIGLQTIAAINACDSTLLIGYIRVIEVQWYAAWARHNPDRQALLHGLDNRAEA